MPQLFLDPGNIPSACLECEHVPPAIPQAVRQLKHLPDLDLLLPGDLILISPLTPTSVQGLIQKDQWDGGYSKDDARWTHAAVYLGFDFNICEATGEGVHQASLLGSLATCMVRARRHPTINSDTRWKIAVAAALQIGTPYGIASTLKMHSRAKQGFYTPQQAKTQSPNGVNCSELFADAFLLATRITLQDTQVKGVSPAYLSFVKELEDVPLVWRSLPS